MAVAVKTSSDVLLVIASSGTFISHCCSHRWARMDTCPSYLGDSGSWDLQKFKEFSRWGTVSWEASIDKVNFKPIKCVTNLFNSSLRYTARKMRSSAADESLWLLVALLPDPHPVCDPGPRWDFGHKTPCAVPPNTAGYATVICLWSWNSLCLKKLGHAHYVS